MGIAGVWKLGDWIKWGGWFAALLLAGAGALLLAWCRRTRAELRAREDLDPLTGGGNAQWFCREAARRIRQGKPGSYVLADLDIDKFRVINDSFGHESGDRTLRHIYTVLKDFLSPGELAARLAADHFGLLIENGTADELAMRIYDLTLLINDFNFHQERKYFLLLSLGLYVVEDARAEVLPALDRARTACRNAKQQEGGGMARYCFFCEEDRIRMLREKEMENRIEDALADREFVVYLQPKLDLRSNTVAGCEALVRWQDPQKGLLPPSEFIELFERNGFIVALDLYMFREVCATLRRWLDEGRDPVPVSLNLSRVNLKNPAFLEPFEEIRREYGVPPSLIELELTESIVLENFALLREVFARIHALGYRFSLDDFGSGYSSLNILKAIPVDVIKLDRAFFQGEPGESERGTLVVESVLELARRLHIRTVCEGVETAAQVEFLRGEHCDMIQSYFFSKPLPVAAFEALAYPARGDRDAGAR